eukprot:9482413-Pyramimonas_sp.AAC.1
MAGFPAGKLAEKVNAVRIAVVSEPNSTSIYSVRRKSGHCSRTSRPPTCAAAWPRSAKFCGNCN